MPYNETRSCRKDMSITTLIAFCWMLWQLLRLLQRRDLRFSQRSCWRFASSGMLYCISWLTVTEGQKERNAFTFRVKHSKKSTDLPCTRRHYVCSVTVYQSPWRNVPKHLNRLLFFARCSHILLFAINFLTIPNKKFDKSSSVKSYITCIQFRN